MNIKFQQNKRRVVASVLSLLMVMQQSATYQAVATTITDINGNALGQIGGQYQITPDMVNEAKGVGFRKFQDFNLSKGDVANFLFTYYNQGSWVNDGNSYHDYKTGSIDTFVAAVKNQVNINGIVNTLNDIGGNVGGNLVFVSPKGVVVGASGVLNVGSLTVMTPTEGTFNNLADNHEYTIHVKAIDTAGRKSNVYTLQTKI